MHHDERGGGGELDGEVAVGHGVQRVFRHRLEAEEFGGIGAVDGKARAGQGGGAERQHVDAPAAVTQARRVAHEHLEPGEQVVAEGDRLRDLQMGESGHQGLGLALGHL